MSRDSRGQRERQSSDDRFDSITGQDTHGSDHADGPDSRFDSGHEGAFDQVRFSLNGDRVKKVEEYDNGVWRAERIEKGESWTFDGSSLIHREREHGALQTSTFTDADGDGIFTRVDRSGSALLGGSGPLGL